MLEFNIKNTHKFYEEYREHEKSIWGLCFKWLIEDLNRNLRKNLDILDIGYGYGTILVYLMQNYKNLDLNGLDIQEELRHLDLKDSSVNFYKFNFEKEIPFKFINKKFDIIICTETFEHFNFSPIDNLLKIKELLKQNGRLYFSTPEQESWGKINIYYKNFEQLLNTKYNSDFSYTDDHFWHYSLENLKFIFKKTKFKIEKLEYTKNEKNLKYYNIILKNIS